MLKALNPHVNFVYDVGFTALTLLHESHHAAGDHDETSTECAAMARLAGFIATYAPADEQAQAPADAQQTDALAPAIYHSHAC
jgi:hypothetical protein